MKMSIVIVFIQFITVVIYNVHDNDINIYNISNRYRKYYNRLPHQDEIFYERKKFLEKILPINFKE